MADIGEVLGFSGAFVSSLLNETNPGRVRSVHVPRIIKALNAVEKKRRAEIANEDSKSAAKGDAVPVSPRQKRPGVGRTTSKCKLFIASSRENQGVAYDMQEALEDYVETTVWSQGVFALSKTALESLIDRLRYSDFGVFILAPDDVTKIRKASKQTVRDNVIFELGLFVGHLGRERCFVVVPRGVDDLHLPTDLLGITAAKYDPGREDKNLLASLGPACNHIRREVAKLGPVHRSA